MQFFGHAGSSLVGFIRHSATNNCMQPVQLFIDPALFVLASSSSGSSWTIFVHRQHAATLKALLYSLPCSLQSLNADLVPPRWPLINFLT